MIIPYITFCGECREVLEFYRTVFNGTVRMLQTYGSYVPENVDAYINLPPTETFYSAFHGGITDKYGVSWNITAEEAPGSTQVRQ